jgi:translation initiation factor 1
MNRTRLVYSTDPRDNRYKCPTCGEFQDSCKCIREESSDKSYTVIFRLEKGGRGGKTVTVMDGWPRNDKLLKDMTKEFKSKCGTGGTYILTKDKAIIEIQGDQREPLKKILTAKGIKFKGM